MKLLLDTHAFIWWVEHDDQLSDSAQDAILNATNEIYVSAVTGYEIASKVRARKLKFDIRLLENFADAVSDLGFRDMAITLSHACRAGLLSAAHRDPFDRLLAAQCELEGATLITRDRAFAVLGIPTFW